MKLHEEFLDDRPIDWNAIDAPAKDWNAPEPMTPRDLRWAAVIGLLMFLAGRAIWILGICYFG